MSSINIDVDTAVTLPVNAVGLVDDTDFKTPEEAIAYNASGMDLEWHFITSAGVYSVTSVTPTTGGGDYDWSHSGNAKYKIGVPASGGASINNDAEGYGWFEGQVTGVLPFRSPTFRFRAASVNDALCDGGDVLDVNMTQAADQTISASGSVNLSNLDASISSRATPTNVSDAQTAIINAVNAVNTGAARYISIHTNAAYEIPDSGSVAYPIEIRTFDADGEPIAIDSSADPTVTVTRTTDAADLSGNLAAISSPATGVYRTTLTITEGTDSVAPLRIDASGTIATVTRSTSSYPVITDATAVDFTATDRANLALILEDTGTTLPGLIATIDGNVDAVKAKTDQFAFTVANQVDANALSGGGGLDAAGVRTAIGMASANMDTQLGNIQAGVDGISVSASPTLLQTTTIATLASQTSFTLTAGAPDNDAYNTAIAIIVDQATSTQKTVVNISDYIGSTRTVTLSESPKFEITTGDTVYIVATSKTTLTEDVVNSLTGTVTRFVGPVWTGSGWDQDFIKGDSYLGGLAVNITIDNWAGDQLISAASEIKLSGTRTVNGTTTSFEWSITPGNVTVSGSTTTIPVELTSADTNITAGEYTADLRATWASPAETVSLLQPKFKLRVVDPVSTF